MQTITIPVSELHIGDAIPFGKNKAKLVRTITPCTQRGKIHVNGGDCYDLCGTVDIRVDEFVETGRAVEPLNLWPLIMLDWFGDEFPTTRYVKVDRSARTVRA